MDDTKEQLDKTTLCIFHVLEDLYAKQDQLEQVMSEGFLGISRTRYTLGVKRVSADQILNAELTAIYTAKINDNVTTDLSSSLNGAVELITGNETDEVKVFELCDEFANMSVGTKKDNNDKNPEDTDASETKGLRKRNVPGTNKEETGSKENSEQLRSTEEEVQENANSEGNSVKGSKEEQSKLRKRRKPISLFGVLVPQSLQSSQKCFEEAVKIAVSIADLRCRLNILQENYKKLRSMKETLIDKEVGS